MDVHKWHYWSQIKCTYCWQDYSTWKDPQLWGMIVILRENMWLYTYMSPDAVISCLRMPVGSQWIFISCIRLVSKVPYKRILFLAMIELRAVMVLKPRHPQSQVAVPSSVTATPPTTKPLLLLHQNSIESKMLRFSSGLTRIRHEYIWGAVQVRWFGDKAREARVRWFGRVCMSDDGGYIGRGTLKMELPGL